MAVETSEKRQPTVAELRDLGKKEPEWVQQASAYHRSRDLGEFSDERRAQMEKVQGTPAKEHEPIYHLRQYGQVSQTEMNSYIATGTIGGSGEVTPAKEHAKPEAVREMERDDGYEMG